MQRIEVTNRYARIPRPMTYDAIVVGLGGVGSATLYQLAARGLKVLGIDQYTPPHPHGSSHGQTRVFRTAYFEHPSYVPLLRRAADLWRETERRCDSKLYHETGLLEVGPSDGVVIPGIMRSATEFNLPLETMSMSEAKTRFPGIEGDESWTAVIEQQAGYLAIEACVDGHLTLAKQFGAVVRLGATVDRWQTDGAGVNVTVEGEHIAAERIVLAGGPWSAVWLERYGVALSVVRKHMYWYRVQERNYHQDAGFPCYFFETPAGFFYGTPALDELGLKVARHSGGEAIASLEPVHSRDTTDQRLCESFLRSS
ncbi:MAG: N-methyl-L-tryptophan oxidase, partial [Planctomycetota bacterium]